MATTNIEAAAVLQTGVSSVSSNFVTNAQRFVVANVPKNLLKWSSTFTIPGNHGGNTSDGVKITMPTGTDSILDVSRNGFSAAEVPYNMKGFIANTASLHLATNTYPKYYLDDTNPGEGVRIIVKPIPTDSETAIALYVDYTKVDDDSDLSAIVTNHVIAQCFYQLAKEMSPSAPVAKVPPSSPSAPSFGSSLTISSAIPVVPSLSAQSITLPTSSIPTYLPPSFTAPTFSATQPTYTPPVVSPDYSNADSFITDEDSELVAARMSVIQGQLGQYQADGGVATAKFQQEQQEWANNLQEYTTKYSQYLAEYQSDIQNNLNTFQKESKQYDAEVQEAVQEAQLSDKQEDRKLQKFTAELTSYTQAVASEVQDYQHTLAKANQEYQAELAKYQAELGSYQAQVGEEQTIFSTKLAKVQLYLTSASQAMQACLQEVQNYVNYNSKMIGAGLVAQQSQQQQQQRR